MKVNHELLDKAVFSYIFKPLGITENIRIYNENYTIHVPVNTDIPKDFHKRPYVRKYLFDILKKDYKDISFNISFDSNFFTEEKISILFLALCTSSPTKALNHVFSNMFAEYVAYKEKLSNTSSQRKPV